MGSGILGGMNRTLPLSLIAALGENRVIGVDNSMPIVSQSPTR